MSNSEPLVSVIVPAYNHDQFLEKRLSSIFNQTFQNFELILMDDCSTDKSRQILEQYRENDKVSKVVLNTTNSGSTFVQWNKGVELAQGRYIWIAESDDVAAPSFLEVVTHSILADPTIVLSYTNSMRINQEDKEIGLWNFEHRKLKSNADFQRDFVKDGNLFIVDHLIYQNVLPNASGIVFSKQAYFDAGLADPKIEKCGDWFLWLKMALNGKVAYHVNALNYFRFHDSSVIGSSMDDLRKGLFLNDYDLKLREAFALYLDKSGKQNFTEIKKLNELCYRNELKEDLLYFLKKRNFSKAFLRLKQLMKKPLISQKNHF